MTGDEVKTLLDAIQARADAATKGPWECLDRRKLQEEGFVGCNVVFALEAGRDRTIDGAVYTLPICETNGKGNEDDNNADFIAHARQDVPCLVAAVRVLRMYFAEIAACGVAMMDLPAVKAEAEHRLAAALRGERR